MSTKFEPRTTLPEANDPYYTRKKEGGYNPCILGNTKYLERLWEGCVLPNCVGYVTGRFNEIGKYNSCKYLGNRNANRFIELAEKQGLEISDKPSLGACMVWDSNSCGHVAMVEEIISDTEILTSESGWSYKKAYFKNLTRKKGTGNWGQGKAYTFLGFIKNPAVEEEPEYKIWKKGDTVSLKEGSYVYGTEKKFSSWVYKADLVVVEDSKEDRTVIGKSLDAVTGSCYSNDLVAREEIEINPTPEPEPVDDNIIDDNITDSEDNILYKDSEDKEIPEDEKKSLSKKIVDIVIKLIKAIFTKKK